MRAIRCEPAGLIFAERTLERIGDCIFGRFDPWQVPNPKRGIAGEHLGERAHHPRPEVVDQPTTGLTYDGPCLAEDGVIGPN